MSNLTEDELRTITWAQNTIYSLSELTHGIVNGRATAKNVKTFRDACEAFEMLKETGSRSLYRPSKPKP